MTENIETRAATFQGNAMALDETGILSWLHFGDLHITDEHAENYRDFLALIDHANTHVAGAVNFAVLPGDNAEKGTEEQYRLVRRAVDRLVIPLFVISGDHDVHTGNLDLFRRYLEPNPVRALTAGEYRLIFLDAVDHAAEVGKPGAFGLRDQQLAWLTRELAAATREKRRALLFNHVYPSELGDSSAAVRTLMRRHGVLMVDMGHTHYNELANDGYTIYATTRSTGQIEEGPVGFSIANIDRGVVSWKFKPLSEPLPLVMITSPADRPLIVDPARADQLVCGAVQIRAKIFNGGDPVVRAMCHINGAAPRPMTRIGETSVWQCEWNSTAVEDGEHQVTVRAVTAGGEGQDTIEVLTSQSGNYNDIERYDGDDATAIGEHARKHILGTQLGPNKNGRKW